MRLCACLCEGVSVCMGASSGRVRGCVDEAIVRVSVCDRVCACVWVYACMYGCCGCMGRKLCACARARVGLWLCVKVCMCV